jgi:hypothetical protein
MELGFKEFKIKGSPATKIRKNAKISKFSCFKSQKKKGDEAGQRVLWKT